MIPAPTSAAFQRIRDAVAILDAAKPLILQTSQRETPRIPTMSVRAGYLDIVLRVA
jgi:hypothetical protein